MLSTRSAKSEFKICPPSHSQRVSESTHHLRMHKYDELTAMILSSTGVKTVCTLENRLTKTKQYAHFTNITSY
jgi:hypothetical protein